MSFWLRRWSPLSAITCLVLLALPARASVNFRGIQARSGGFCVVELGSDGMLDLSNIGPSGLDGAIFDCPHMDGTRLAIAGDCNDTDNGVVMRYTYSWTVVSQPAGSQARGFCTNVVHHNSRLSFTGECSGFVSCPSLQTVTLLRSGSPVYRCVVSSGTEVTVSLDATGRCPNPALESHISRSTHQLQCSAAFSRSVQVSVAGHDDNCDSFVIGEVCDPADVDEDCDGVSSDLRIAAPPTASLSHVRCEDGQCRVQGRLYRATGEAAMAAVLYAVTRGVDRHLTLSNLDGSGLAGLQVLSERRLGSDGGDGGNGGLASGGAVMMHFSPPSLHVDPTTDNGLTHRITIDGLSFASGSPVSCSASMKISVVGGNWRCSCSHLRTGAPTQWAVVLSHGQEVYRAPLDNDVDFTIGAPPGGSPDCYITALGSNKGWDLKKGLKVAPATASVPYRATSVSSGSSGVDLDLSCPLSVQFSSSRLIVLGGTSHVGNEVVVYGAQSSSSSGAYTGAFEVTVTTMSVTCPSTVGTCSSVTLDGSSSQGGDQVYADIPPGSCLSSSSPVVPVALMLTRTDGTPARAASVTFHLSSNLALAASGIVEGDYFSHVGDTQMYVTSNGGNSYTADVSVFGPVCGATGDGMLFQVPVTCAGAATCSGTGEVVVDAVELRDCDNDGLPCDAGGASALSLSNSAPSPVSLTATQVRTGNPSGSTTAITLDWTNPGTDVSVAVYRKPFGNYPLYDNPPNAGSPPTPPASSATALSSGWTLCYSLDNHGWDRPASRDSWYYVAFATSSCGDESVCSNMTLGTLDYHLGDNSDGVTTCTGDDHVDLPDVTFMGAHYGVQVAGNPSLTCLDFGPTSDHKVSGRPLTDGKINFEELVLIAINFTVVSAPESRQAPVAAATNATRLAVPAIPAPGGTFEVGVEGDAAGNVQAMAINLDYDHTVLEQVSVAPGRLLDEQARGTVVLSSGPGDVDLAILGTGAGLSGSGELARMGFRVKTVGDPRLSLAGVSARDGANEPITVAGAQPPMLPSHTALTFAFPNPFADATEVQLSLRASGPVTLGVFDVAGRRVRTLVQGVQPAGSRMVSWDGRGDGGARLAPGAYVLRLEAAGLVESRTVRLVR
jgi:hypothetical protein